MKPGYSTIATRPFGFYRKRKNDYFQSIAELVQNTNAEIVVITHLLEDRPEFLSALSQICRIKMVVGIPYSINKSVEQSLRDSYTVITPALTQLNDHVFMANLILSKISKTTPLIIVEIGGYCANAIKIIHEKIGDNLLGVIEDTEAGYRRYASIDNLPCPVVSLARSSLKSSEDAMIGASCVFSFEKILRQLGLPLNGKKSLVCGFGKIGMSVGHTLMRRASPTMVVDIDPVKRLYALAQGFQVPSKENALRQADVVYGCAGTQSINGSDISKLRSGAILVSCSSKDIEFDINFLEKNYKKNVYTDNFCSFVKSGQTIYLAGSGRPINFIDGAVVGPLLSLVQAEIIASIDTLQKLNAQGKTGLFDVDDDKKSQLANTWLNMFCDQTRGYYRDDDL